MAEYQFFFFPFFFFFLLSLLGSRDEQNMTR